MSEISDGGPGTRCDGGEEVTLSERQLWALAAGESVTVEVAGHGEDPVRVAVTPPVPPAPSPDRE